MTGLQATIVAEPHASPVATPRTEWEIELRSRTVGIALLAFVAVLAATVHGSDHAIGWAAGKVMLPTIALGLLPGLLVAIACRARPRWGALDLLGVGIALSLGLAQLPTLIGMCFTLPTSAIALGYAGVVVAAGLLLCLRRGPFCCLTLGRGELLIFAAIVGVSSVAYVKGSPFFSDEEQIHISVIRRIAAEPAPGPHNIYPAEGVAYTHPFPGTHYFMAMVSALGRGDTLFVYHKLRACWTFASFLFLYLLARRIYGDPTVASVTVLTGIALVLNGSYADFFVIFWGQLAPFSHPSDVAMGVLLPGLLLLALDYLEAAERRTTAFFFAAAVLVAAMVTMVHIRETVQLLVYAACLLFVTVVFHRSRTRVVRLLTLMGAMVVMAVAYGILYRHLVSHVADFDAGYKAQLLESIRTGTFQTLIGTPFPFHETTVFFSLFYGWNAVVILAGPLVCLAFRRKPLVLMMGVTVLVYLVILRLPLLSMLYTYFTHVDMLVTPVRNISLFLYLMTGPLFYVIACQARRLPLPWLGGGLAVAAAAGLAWATQLEWPFWLAHYDSLFLPAIGAYLLVGGLVFFKPTTTSMPAWTYGWRSNLVLALMLIAAAAGSGMWERSLLSLHHITTYSPFLGTDAPTAVSPPRLLASLKPVVTPRWELASTNSAFADYKLTLAENVSVPPPARLIRWAKTELPVDAVLAVNGLNAYPLPVFLPQRVAAWPPIVSFNLSYPKQLSPTYYELMDRAVAKNRPQPFFNLDETRDERLEFLARTHTTHVVLDPPSYRDLKHILVEWPSRFESVYDDGEWAVFAVRLDAPPGGD